MLKKEKKMLIQLSEEKKKNQNKKLYKNFHISSFFFIPLVEVSRVRVYRAAPVKIYVCIRCRAELVTLPDHQNVTKKRRDCQKINFAERNSC